MKPPRGKQNVDYQFACKYHFCEGCEHKSKIEKGGKVIRYSCPARFDPYQPYENGQGCPKNELFLKREKDKQEAIRGTNYRG
jgi:hypothetical protein